MKLTNRQIEYIKRREAELDRLELQVRRQKTSSQTTDEVLADARQLMSISYERVVLSILVSVSAVEASF